MTPPEVEIRRDQFAAGRKAQMMLRAFGDLHAEREKQTVNEMIAWFRSNDWDERRAIRYLAVLSENRAQHEELEYRARKGVEAGERLFGDASTAGD